MKNHAWMNIFRLATASQNIFLLIYWPNKFFFTFFLCKYSYFFKKVYFLNKNTLKTSIKRCINNEKQHYSFKLGSNYFWFFFLRWLKNYDPLMLWFIFKTFDTFSLSLGKLYQSLFFSVMSKILISKTFNYEMCLTLFIQNKTHCA